VREVSWSRRDGVTCWCFVATRWSPRRQRGDLGLLRPPSHAVDSPRRPQARRRYNLIVKADAWRFLFGLCGLPSPSLVIVPPSLSAFSGSGRNPSARLTLTQGPVERSRRASTDDLDQGAREAGGAQASVSVRLSIVLA
jgi:hypothetical protein